MTSDASTDPSTTGDPARLGLRTESISWTETEDGQLVVLDLRTSTYMTLNSSATAPWAMLAEGTSRAALVERLATAHALERARAEQDVDAFLDRLRALDLVTEPEGGARR